MTTIFFAIYIVRSKCGSFIISGTNSYVYLNETHLNLHMMPPARAGETQCSESSVRGVPGLAMCTTTIKNSLYL